MPSQQIDLGAIDTVTFDGQDLTRLILDGQTIWQRGTITSDINYTYSAKYETSSGPQNGFSYDPMVQKPPALGRYLKIDQDHTDYDGVGDNGTFSSTGNGQLYPYTEWNYYSQPQPARAYNTFAVLDMGYGITGRVIDGTYNGENAFIKFTLDFSNYDGTTFSVGDTLEDLNKSYSQRLILTLEPRNIRGFHLDEPDPSSRYRTYPLFNGNIYIKPLAVDQFYNLQEFEIKSTTPIEDDISIYSVGINGSFSVGGDAQASFTCGQNNLDMQPIQGGQIAANNDVTRVAAVYRPTTDSERLAQIWERSSIQSSDWAVVTEISLGNAGGTHPNNPNVLERYAIDMNHDGEYLYVHIATLGQVDIYKWDGSTYQPHQTLNIPLTGLGSTPLCYELSPYDNNLLATGQDENTLVFAAGGLTNQRIRAYEEVNGTFYQMGVDLNPSLSSLAGIFISDNTRNSPTQKHGSVVTLLDGGVDQECLFFEHQFDQSWDEFSFPKIPVSGVDPSKTQLWVSKDMQQLVVGGSHFTYSIGNWSSGTELDTRLAASGLDVQYASIASLTGTHDGSRLVAKVFQSNYSKYGYVTYILRSDGLYEREQPPSGVGDGGIELSSIDSSRAYDNLAVPLNPIWGINPVCVSSPPTSDDFSVLLTTDLIGPDGLSSIRDRRGRLSHYQVTRTYTLSAFPLVYEGSSAVVTLTTTSVENGLIPYTITGIQAGDIQEPLTGNFDLVDGSATQTFNITTDGTPESETMTLTLDNTGDSIDILIIDL